MLAILDTSYESGLAIFDASYESQYTAISVAFPTDAENIVDSATVVTDADTAQPTIFVSPEGPSGGYRHFLFKLENANGQQPNFEVENNRVTNFAGSWVPIYTYDFVTWHRGTGFTLDTGTSPGRYKFQFAESFSQSTVWVASHPVMRQADWIALINDLLTNRSSVASPTLSGDAAGVIGQSLADESDSDANRTVGPFDLYAVKLSWGGSTTDGGPKRQMGILVGSHSGEVIDGEMARGAINWMLDDPSADAVRFRSNWEVYIYGLHAVNGRWAGESRVNPHRSTDPNRDWSDLDFSLTESVQIRDAIEADMDVGSTGSKVMHAFFSFHGAGLSTSDILFYPGFGSTDEPAYIAFVPALESLDPDQVVEKSPIDAALASRWMHEQYAAQVSLAPEGQMEADPDPARYREVGAMYAHAVSIVDGQGEFVEGTAVNVSVSEGAIASESPSAAASLALGVTEGAVAGDTATAVAAAVSALHGAAVSGDTDQTTLTALGDIAAAASSSDTHAAAAHVALTIAEGAGAGDTWVAEAQAVADLIAGGAAGEQILAGTEALTSRAITEPGEAGAAFLAAVQAYAGVTGAATSADAFAGAVTTIQAISEAGVAGDTFTAATFDSAVRALSGHAIAGDTITGTFTARTAVTEGAAAGSVFEAVVSALARVSEPALAGDTLRADSRGIGYLVVRAVTITAALAGNHEIEANLSGSPDVKPEK